LNDKLQNSANNDIWSFLTSGRVPSERRIQSSSKEKEKEQKEESRKGTGKVSELSNLVARQHNLMLLWE